MRLPRELIVITPLSKALALLLFITLPLLGFLFGILYQQETQQFILPTENISVERKIPSSPPDSMSNESVDIGTYEGIPVKADTYGFTQSLEMKAIGVKALFPPKTVLTLQEKYMYVAKVGEHDVVTFRLRDYDGQGRRTWFQKEYPYASKYLLEQFNGKKHSGYIAYAHLPEDSPGGFFYFTVINSKKIFIIDGANNLGGQSVFFGSDLQKFKTFLSTIEFIPIIDIPLETHNISNLYRWSDTRKILWEDANLGIKLTAPEWAEFRRATSQYDTNGKIIYSGDWSRTYPEIRAFSDKDDPFVEKRLDIIGTYGPYSNLLILSSKYIPMTFQQVVEEQLIPAGFCASEWKPTKSGCSNSSYCYTKDEVLQNLTVIKEVKNGDLVAQLRSMNESFSGKNDCRAEDTWLIKGKSGQYILTNVSPDSKDFRWEPL